jgi:RNA polymerase sigma factor (TIGR02999 family)
MAAPSPGDITGLLRRLAAGDPDAQSRLLQAVYDELRDKAGGFMRGERPGHSWQPTELVHEGLLRLFGGRIPTESRGAFFAAAARAMRELLVEHALARGTQKRGGGWQRVPLDDVVDHFERQNLDVAAVDEALERLAALNPRQSQIVTWRFFGRFTVEDIAEMLEVSVSTVESDWRLARAWLHGQLAETPS